MHGRECRWYSALSIIAPSVNVLAGRAGNHRRSEALHRMSLSDNLRRLARERVPTAPPKWLGPSTPTLYTNDSTVSLQNWLEAADRTCLLRV